MLLVPTLEDIIKNRIAASGPITFRDFMDMALYYPELGYYSKGTERVGQEGDFYTSPTTHPVFGALLALQLEQMWELLDRPPQFQIVEAGAGKGLLARDILDYLPHLSPPFARSVRYTAWEKQKITAIPNPFVSPTGAADTSLPERVTGCFLSNELLDAMPVHRVVMHSGHLNEIYVTVKNNNFRDLLGELSSPLLKEYLAHEDIPLVEGQQAEINLNVIRWVSDTGKRLEKGFLITIDYGYLAPDLYSAGRKQGTLMTYQRHIAGDNPYINIGEQDLTTHIDFSAIISTGLQIGLAAEDLISQEQFLENLGFKSFMQALRRKRLPQQKYIANRFAMLELVRTEGFGQFQVLLQSKGMERVHLYGLNADNDLVKKLREQRDSLFVPLLHAGHIPLLEAKYPEYAGLSKFTDDATK